MKKVKFSSDFTRAKPLEKTFEGVDGLPNSKLLSGEIVNFTGIRPGYRFFLSQNHGEGSIYYNNDLIVEFKGTYEISFKGQAIQIKPENLGWNPDLIVVSESLGSIKICGKPNGSTENVYLNGLLVANLQYHKEGVFHWLLYNLKKRQWLKRDCFEGIEYDENKIDLDIVLAIYFHGCLCRVTL